MLDRGSEADHLFVRIQLLEPHLFGQLLPQVGTFLCPKAARMGGIRELLRLFEALQFTSTAQPIAVQLEFPSGILTAEPVVPVPLFFVLLVPVVD